MIWGYLHFRKPPFFPLHRHFMEPIAPRKTATVRRLLASAGIRAWRAQVEPGLGNGNHTTYKNGESLAHWGVIYGIVFTNITWKKTVISCKLSLDDAIYNTDHPVTTPMLGPLGIISGIDTVKPRINHPQ
jgi:hypothetical protein